MKKITRSFVLTNQQLKYLADEAKKLGITVGEVLRLVLDKARGAL